MAKIKSTLPAKVLIVDDEPDIREIISYNLTKSGFETDTARDGKEALLKLTSYRPDLILLDVMMPNMDGINVCRTIREDHQYDNMLIAFLTARGEDYTQETALDNGADDFIIKPIKPNLLVARVKALLRRASSIGPPEDTHTIEIGNLQIDKEQFTVKVDGKTIDLANKEFQLLLLMASKPGKVFTREEIFRKIWGNEVMVGYRTIDVHIRKVREKLGENIIRTIKGMGYKLNS